ncbi:MAG: hypothetical protein ACMVY4_15030 [Minwuia sp.]|uniref:hypothetical protein n=1 Tax=Minwuia sp. TaxID=2493630 RepID=UPI003A874F91
MAEARTIWIAVAAAVLLPLAALAVIGAAARAPDGHTGRILVIFDGAPGDTEAFATLARHDARPLRVIASVGGWIAEAEGAGTVEGLREDGSARFVFRDVGLGRAMAGCLGLANGPARPKGIVP